MKVRVSSLRAGAAIDWLVARCEGRTMKLDPMGHHSGSEAGYWIWEETPSGRGGVILSKSIYMKIGVGGTYSPSTDFALGAKLLNEAKISRTVDHSGVWIAYSGYNLNDEKEHMQGDADELVAGFRCYLACKLGDLVDVPDHLIQNGKEVDESKSAPQSGKTSDADEVIKLRGQVALLQQAARLIHDRPGMVSGSLQMAECDAVCKDAGLEGWTWPIPAPRTVELSHEMHAIRRLAEKIESGYERGESGMDERQLGRLVELGDMSPELIKLVNSQKGILTLVSEWKSGLIAGDALAISIEKLLHDSAKLAVVSAPISVAEQNLREKLAQTFIEYLRRDMGPQDYALMGLRNLAEGKTGICHSHDFLDANLTMNEAFTDVVGHPAEIQNSNQAALWSDAWRIATEKSADDADLKLAEVVAMARDHLSPMELS